MVGIGWTCLHHFLHISLRAPLNVLSIHPPLLVLPIHHLAFPCLSDPLAGLPGRESRPPNPQVYLLTSLAGISSWLAFYEHIYSFEDLCGTIAHWPLCGCCTLLQSITSKRYSLGTRNRQPNNAWATVARLPSLPCCPSLLPIFLMGFLRFSSP